MTPREHHRPVTQRLLYPGMLAALLCMSWGSAAAQTKAPSESLVAGQVTACEQAHDRCVASSRAQCDTPMSTSDVREACWQRCTRALDDCKSTRARQAAALAEVERTGGPKPAQCPRGWMVEQAANNKFGAFKCFATGAAGAEPTLPSTFQCPPGLQLVKGIDAVFCQVPR